MPEELVRPSGATAVGATRRHGIIAAAAALLGLAAVVALAAPGQNERRAGLSETFADGPDPDAPAMMDLWNNGMSGMAERSPQQPVAPKPPAQQELVGGEYAYSESGYRVKRLERVIKKMKVSESEFSEVDRQREEIMRQVQALEQRAEGLALQAKDIKEDLERYSQQQAQLVAELHPKIAAAKGEAEGGAGNATGAEDAMAGALPDVPVEEPAADSPVRRRR